MELKTSLSLNTHPKDCDNVSLVSATNMKLSNDQSRITNEEGIISHNVINYELKLYYNGVAKNGKIDIVGVIPCNTELVIIISYIDYNDSNKSDIFRYNEKEDKLIHSYSKYEYNGGVITGTYTYNVENSLILTIAEDTSSLGIKTPLKTINLGNINDENISNDLNLVDQQISVVPEVRIPSVTNIKYIKGNAYKGWYYCFIRYKINTIDYTQWYSFGTPIYVDSIETNQIMRYCYSQEINLDVGNHDDNGTRGLFCRDNFPDGYCVGMSDDFSGNTDIAKNTFMFDIDNLHEGYHKYQIGFVCASKSYTKSYRTSDIDKNNNVYIFDNKKLINISVEELISNNYNYFNVKNVINYKNRLYISNYEETPANDKDIIKEDEINNIIKNVKLSLSVDTIKINDYKDNIIITDVLDENNNTNQFTYDWIDGLKIPLKDYLKIPNIIDSNYIGILKNPNDDINNPDYSIPIENCYLKKIEDDNHNYIQLYIIDEFNSPIELVGSFKIYDYYNKKLYNLDTTVLGMCKKTPILQSKTDFINRINNSTLLPNETYKFYIHCVDKYGNNTNGYPLVNQTKGLYVRGEDETKLYDVINIHYNGEFNVNRNGNVEKTFSNYLFLAIDENITVSEYKNESKSFRVFMLSDDKSLYDEIDLSINDDLKTLIKKDYLSILYSDKNTFDSFYIYQILNTGYHNAYKGKFGKNINKNGDSLFKVPEAIQFDVEEYVTFKLKVENVIIPKGYVGYFISYEKFEPTKQVTGFLTRNDFHTQSIIRHDNTFASYFETANLYKSDNMCFYSDDFDIKDTLKLDYNLLTVVAENKMITNDIEPYDEWQRNKFTKYPYNYNSIADYRFNNRYRKYDVEDIKLCPADDMSSSRIGLGTAVSMKIKDDLFDNTVYDSDWGITTSDADELIKTYIAELSNISNNLYTNKNKTLFKLGNIIYNSDEVVIENGYNGRYTNSGVIIYDNAGVVFDETEFAIRRVRGNVRFYPKTTKNFGNNSYMANRPFASYFQYGSYDTIIHESKRFNNKPKNYIFPIKGLNNDGSGEDAWNNGNLESSKTFHPGCIVEPKNSIDLFKNPQGGQDDFNPVVYTNYRDDLVDVYKLNKTIRRSDVIQDESRKNAWRNFPLEGYKSIVENKGIITNLVGIGYYLLVHTEHSLFLFNTSNNLVTQDKDVQLKQSDVFEVDYKEIFTSDFGYGGLQNKESVIVDQFGYIFYNEEFNHLYKFDNNRLSVIDENFHLWLKKHNPKNVIFVNDKFNNRLLIRFDILNKTKDKIISEVFSYNYNTNELVSSHNYLFKKGYNTEVHTYMLNCKQDEVSDEIYVYNRYNDYGVIPKNMLNVDKINKHNNNIYNSEISIIVNINYDIVKFLEYIKYRLRKIDTVEKDYDYLPVEGKSFPYAGDTLRVYSDECDTKDIDINVNHVNKYNAWKKPYFELGNWNFNYFRNNIDTNPIIKSSKLSRIYGNFIVIKFIFDNKDKQLIEFEDINVVLSKDRK